jgi:hypothetical protein
MLTVSSRPRFFRSRHLGRSPWFAGECLSQRCQPVERGGRQRAFLDRLLSKELLIDDGGWVPNLVGSVGWTSPTSRGSAFSPIPYVSGFQAGLTADR